MGCQYLMKFMSVKCHAFLLLVRKNKKADEVMAEGATFISQNID
jgi:hypothetical protein